MSHQDIAAAFRDEITRITQSVNEPIEDSHAQRVADRAAQIVSDWSVFEAWVLATLLLEACAGNSAVADPDPAEPARDVL